ncbi:MAG: CerR family C-terminal domain-containing protein [Desulfobacterales bacterium]|nr:CerR family C-terminal domain-containing protein [Desulfobacterales bacterium]
MGTPKDSLITRSKIIQAAGRLFTDKGFKGVTVREISREAAVNLGALNYHFKSKEALYREVLLDACREAAIPEVDQAVLLSLPPEEALFTIIKEALTILRTDDTTHWQSALLSRECREPSPVFDELTETYFKPQADFLVRIIAAAAGRLEADMRVRLAGISVVGLIETCGLYRRYTDAVAPGLTTYGDRDDWFAHMITRTIIHMAETTHMETDQ